MKRTPLRRSTKPIRRCSTNRARQLREYSVRRTAFLIAHPWCQVWLAEHGVKQADVNDRGFAEVEDASDVAKVGRHFMKCPASCDIHHTHGRVGTMLLDERYWLAVSRQSHEWIHQHPSLARERGYLR